MASLPDLVKVNIEFSPSNLSEAVVIIRTTLRNDDAMYSAWVASVESWLEQTHEVTRSGLARAFVDWIAGDDVPVGDDDLAGGDIPVGNDDNAGDDVPDGHNVEDPDDILP